MQRDASDAGLYIYVEYRQIIVFLVRFAYFANL